MGKQFFLKLYRLENTSRRQMFLTVQAILVMFLFCNNKVVAEVTPEFDTNSSQQERVTYTGLVIDDAREPIIGATVTVKDKSTGTVTDVNGNFTITANTGDVLVVSFIGYNTVELRTGTGKHFEVILTEDTKLLDEVVVIGYGTQLRADLTGAISSVSTRDIGEQPIVDVNQALLGQAAGVNVMNTSGAPGGGLDIQIRGISTIGSSNTPLYVVDGNIIQVAMDADSNPLGFLNPSDIESIDILKDASAAAIYGSRGSNGVVLITTKGGQKGKAKITYNVKGGVQEVFNQIDMLSARDFALLAIEARNNTWVDRGTGDRSPLDGDDLRPESTKTAYFRDFLNSGKQGTDWMQEVFRQALFQEHQISVSGGSDNVTYLVSGGFLDNQGTLRNTGFQRYSVRANIDANVTRKLRVNLRLAPSYTNQDFLPVTGRFHEANAGIVQSALLMNPILDVYDPESDTGYSTGINLMQGLQNMENPVAKINQIKDWRRNFNLVSNASAIYDINKFFTFTLTGGATIRSASRNWLSPSTLGAYGIRAPRDNAIFASQNINYNLQGSAQLSYNQQIGKHRMSGVAVREMQMQQVNTVAARASATWTDELIVVDSSLENVLREGNSNITEWALSSYLARMHYDYDRKYLVTASIRADGSSKFADRWGVFPSVALSWRVSNENFLKNVRWLSNLRFRASIGVTGNNSIGDYQYMSLMGGSSAVLGSGGESIVSGIRLNSYGNSDLTWEQTQQSNIGMDLALFRNRVSFTVDYYDKQTENLLLNLQVPSNMGFSNVMTNIGKVQNRGWEISIDSRNLVGHFRWNTNFNITFNRQKVLALGPEGDPLWGNSIYMENTHITRVGDPMGLFYGLKVLGIYQNQQQVDELPGISSGVARSRPGEFIFQNVDDSDNEITLEDRTVIGSPHPKFVFGLRNGFGYKNFTLSVMLRGSYGADMINLNFGNIPYSLQYNGHVSLKNRWKSEEEPGNGKIPRLSLETRAVLGSTTFNSSFVEKADFLNIQNVTLGYNLPDKLAKKMRAESLSAQLSVNNLHMFTNYNGWNPEGGMYTDTTLSPGLDWGRYPLSRIYTLGLNLTF